MFCFCVFFFEISVLWQSVPFDTQIHLNSALACLSLWLYTLLFGNSVCQLVLSSMYGPLNTGKDKFNWIIVMSFISGKVFWCQQCKLCTIFISHNLIFWHADFQEKQVLYFLLPLVSFSSFFLYRKGIQAFLLFIYITFVSAELSLFSLFCCYPLSILFELLSLTCSKWTETCIFFCMLATLPSSFL